MSEETKSRPEFYNGVRVRMPEDYDFNSWGRYHITQVRTIPITRKITN